MLGNNIRDIGGGIVRRQFTAGGVTYQSGERLAADVITAWPASNRRALIDQRFVEVYPAAHSNAQSHGRKSRS